MEVGDEGLKHGNIEATTTIFWYFFVFLDDKSIKNGTPQMSVWCLWVSIWDIYVSWVINLHLAPMITQDT